MDLKERLEEGLEVITGPPHAQMLVKETGRLEKYSTYGVWGPYDKMDEMIEDVVAAKPAMATIIIWRRLPEIRYFTVRPATLGERTLSYGTMNEVWEEVFPKLTSSVKPTICQIGYRALYLDSAKKVLIATGGAVIEGQRYPEHGT